MLPFNGFHSEVIDYKDVEPVQFVEELLVFALKTRDSDSVHKFLHRVVCYAVTLSAGFVAKGACKI